MFTILFLIGVILATIGFASVGASGHETRWPGVMLIVGGVLAISTLIAAFISTH